MSDQEECESHGIKSNVLDAIKEYFNYSRSRIRKKNEKEVVP